MAVLGLLDGGSVTLRRMKAFAVENDMDRGGGSCFRQLFSGFIVWYDLEPR